MQLAEGGNVRPVQPQEAAQGRLDYVKARLPHTSSACQALAG